MKRLKQMFYFWRMKYKLWRWRRFMKALAKYGTVREIQDIADRMREIAERHNDAEFKAVAEMMHAAAEKVVMRRVFKR